MKSSYNKVIIGLDLIVDYNSLLFCSLRSFFFQKNIVLSAEQKEIV